MGSALPGHLVDEGKLVLFLDEEITSRAPKCGKRRTAETHRLKAASKPKKRKVEGGPPPPSSSSSKTAGAADIIVVGGGPAEDRDPDPGSDPESESDPDQNVIRAPIRPYSGAYRAAVLR